MKYQVGNTIHQTVRGRSYTYRVVAIRPHTKRWGVRGAVLVWAGDCAVCDAAFEATTHEEQIIKTCPKHRGWL
jgi:hypothetical protein